MIISPTIAVERGWITGIKDPDKQVGSDGIDLTLNRIGLINVDVQSVLSEDKSKVIHRTIDWLEPADHYTLDNHAYDISFNEFIRLPNGVAAILLLRSSFVRAGHSMFSGLYDQGFENYGGAVLHIKGSAMIEAGMRVAQIIFLDSPGSGKLYAGGYNYQTGDGSWQDAALRQGSITH